MVISRVDYMIPGDYVHLLPCGFGFAPISEPCRPPISEVYSGWPPISEVLPCWPPISEVLPILGVCVMVECCIWIFSTYFPHNLLL